MTAPYRTTPPGFTAAATVLWRAGVSAVALLTLTAPLPAQESASAASILADYAEDYRHDPTLVAPVAFGIEVEGAWWHVEAVPGANDAPHEVTLAEGPPPEPTFYFTMDRETLGKLDRGELNAGTAMVKEFSTDPSPMDADFMEGMEPDASTLPTLLKVAFHFWNRGNPEIIPFGESLTRHTHGADAVIFYYQPGFRSGWGSLKPGQHANEDPRSQVNPFPSLIIATEGRAMARIGGNEIELEKGQAVIIPPDVMHELWNPFDRPMEFVLLMFGEGA